MVRVLDQLSDIPLAGLMAVVTAGYLLGRLRWRELSFGPAGGTLTVALLFGWLGLSLELLYGEASPPLTVGGFGFALFIYSIGFEAGPQFFQSLRNAHGWKCVGLGALVVVVALGLALGLGLVCGFDAPTTAGLLAGGMTSASAFAAAADGVGSNSPHLSIAFALTYPVGLIGLVLLVQTVPRLLRTDLSQGSSEHETEEPPAPAVPELTRAFRVDRPEVAGRTLRELDLGSRTGCVVSSIRRGAEVLEPHAEQAIACGDHLLVVGLLHELQALGALVGPEVYDAELRLRVPVPRRVIVASAQAAGRTLRDIDLSKRFRVLVKAVERGATRIDPNADTILLKEDVVELLGPRDRVRAAARFLGAFEPATNVTDIAVYAGGILAGLLLGSIHLRPLGLDLTLGHAGGLLLSGILLATLRRFGPVRAGVPPAARQLVRDLGVLLFVAEVGVAAGHALEADLDLHVPLVLLAGLAVTVVPVLTALAVGHFVLGLRPVDSWGSICGGMTSSAALSAIKRAADSNEPAVSYAAAFAVASVLVTAAGQVVMRVVG